tara:strand:- start:1255 stop:1545 length:291 start_codon:yes stop_codon:yes gene_type:complete
MKHPGAMRLKPNRWRELKFKVRNFIAGRIHRIKFNTVLWFKVKARRRKAAKYDPVWKESWWCLERRYTKLAKKFTRLELKYLKQKDTIRRLRDGNS